MAYVSKKPFVLSIGMIMWIGLDIFLYTLFAPLSTFIACMSVLIIAMQFYLTASVAEAMSVESFTVDFHWFLNFFRSEKQKRNSRAKKRFDQMEAMVNNVLSGVMKDGSEEAIERGTRIIDFIDKRRAVELNMILNPEETLPQLAAPKGDLHESWEDLTKGEEDFLSLEKVKQHGS